MHPLKWLIVPLMALASLATAQVSVSPAPYPHQFFPNSIGIACAGCSLYSYAAGTTTPLATYVDSTGTGTNTNPIILDATGSANIWLSNASYKFLLKDISGTTLWSVDNIPGQGSGGSGPCITIPNSIQFNNSGLPGCSTATFTPSNQTTTIPNQQNLSLYGIAPPAAPPTVAVGSAGVLTGTYTYNVDFETAAGEGYLTSAGFSATVSPSSQQVNLSAIPVSSSPDVVARNIYRCAQPCTVPELQQLVATIPDNTTTTYIDNIPDGSLGAYGPWTAQGFGAMTVGGLGNVFSVGNASLSLGQGNGPVDYADTFLGNYIATGCAGCIRDVMVGLFAGQGIVSAQGSTALGVHSCAEDVSGSGDICIGYNSGYWNNGQSTIAIGQGTFNTSSYTGTGSLAIGTNVFTYLTGSTSYQTCVGYECGFQTLPGSAGGLVGFGPFALGNGTTWSDNTAIGQGAMSGSTTFANNTGSHNTAEGYDALTKLAGGANNVANGMFAGFNLGAGNDNDLSGYATLFSATASTGFSAHGFQSFNAATGTGGTGNGFESCEFITSGNYDNCDGYQAGAFYTGGGSNQNTTSDHSIYLGPFTGPLANGDTNEIVICNTCYGNGSNTATIGNGSTTAVYMGTTRMATTGGVQASGTQTLALGTATVSNAAACAVGATCNYTLTHCGVNASTAIGVLSTGTISAGVSFVINALTLTGTVATGDLSTVCWRIN